MRQLIFVFAFCFFNGLLLAQQKVITGLVKDIETGESIIGANVNCSQINKIVQTDVYGLFKLGVPTNVNINITASYVGYQSKTIEINANESGAIQILLTRGLLLQEINIQAKQPIEERFQLGALEIPVRQINALPMLGEPDVLKVIQLLPGVQSGSDGRIGLYVRGGGADQNLYLLDGTPLYFVSHAGGFVSLFHPNILKNVTLYKGNFPARYGGRLSSVIDLRMNEGNKKEHHGSWGVGLISGDLCFEGPIIKDRTSYIISTRRVWLDLLMRPITRMAFEDFDSGYNFYDFYGKISHVQNAKNRFYFSLYMGDDRNGYNYNFKNEKTKGHTRYIWGNVLSSLRWNKIFNAHLSSDITLSYTKYRFKIDKKYTSKETKGSEVYSSGIQNLSLKSDFNYFINDHFKLKYGIGLSLNWFSPGEISYQNTYDHITSDTIIGSQSQLQALSSNFYLENEISITKWMGVNIGARLSNYLVQNQNYTSIEPRISCSLHKNRLGSINFGYSEMTQPVHMVSYSGSFLPTDLLLPSTSNISPGKSIQYSIGYAKTVAKGMFDLSIEVYKKDLTNLLELKSGSSLFNTESWEDSFESNGTGKSKGLEIMLQKNQGRTTGWLSYCLSKSEREFININNGNKFPFKYDRRHDLTFVLSHKLSDKIDFSATWTYGSGYPTTLQNGISQSIGVNLYGVDSPDQTFFNQNGTAYLFPEKNWLRMRDYHRLDLGINFNKSKGNKVRTWTIGVFNAYSRQNAVFYYYKHENDNKNNPIKLYQQSGLPIIPTVKYSIKF